MRYSSGKILKALSALPTGAQEQYGLEKKAAREEETAHREEYGRVNRGLYRAGVNAQKELDKMTKLATLIKLIPGFGTLAGIGVDLTTDMIGEKKAVEARDDYIEEIGLLDTKNKFTADIEKFTSDEFMEGFGRESILNALTNAVQTEIASGLGEGIKKKLDKWGIGKSVKPSKLKDVLFSTLGEGITLEQLERKRKAKPGRFEYVLPTSMSRPDYRRT